MLVRQNHSHLIFLDAGDFAATIRRWAEAVERFHLHLAEALGVVDDGAPLAAPHLNEVNVQVVEVDGGAARQEVGRKSRKIIFLHLPFMKGSLGWALPSFTQDGLRQTRSGLTQSK